MFRSSGFRHPPSFELVRGRFASFKGIREGFAPVTLSDVARISMIWIRTGIGLNCRSVPR
jgi:hypothetical protein